MLHHIHISAIDCDKRIYMNNEYTCLATKEPCDFLECMTCKRARQFANEQKLRNMRKSLLEVCTNG